jgi:hypothetical protein
MLIICLLYAYYIAYYILIICVFGCHRYLEETPTILSLAFMPQQTPSGRTLEGHHLLTILHTDEGDDAIRTVNLSCVSMDLAAAAVHTGPWAVRYAYIFDHN